MNVDEFAERIRLTELRAAASIEDHAALVVARLLSSRAGRLDLSLARLLRVAAIAHALLLASRSLTRRDILYIDELLFAFAQPNADRALDRLAHLIDVPRSALNILPAPKGLVSGPVSIRYVDSPITLDIVDLDVAAHGAQGAFAPVRSDRIFDFHTPAKFVLVSAQIAPDDTNIVTPQNGRQVVEKEAIYSQIVKSNFQSDFGPCIVATGKGTIPQSTDTLSRRPEYANILFYTTFRQGTPTQQPGPSSTR